MSICKLIFLQRSKFLNYIDSCHFEKYICAETWKYFRTAKRWSAAYSGLPLYTTDHYYDCYMILAIHGLTAISDLLPLSHASDTRMHVWENEAAIAGEAWRLVLRIAVHLL